MNREPSSRLPYICKLVHETLRLPVALIGPDYTAIQEWGDLSGDHPRSGTQKKLLLRMADGATAATVPVIRSTNDLEHAIVLPVDEAGSERGYVAIGPVLYSAPLAETIQALLEDNGIPREERAEWTAYYRTLPVVTQMQLAHAAIMLHLLVHDVALEAHDILNQTHALERPLVPSEELEQQLLSRRENETLHHDPYMEGRLFDCIRNGDKAGALRMLAAFPEESFGVLSRTSHLRNRKNLAIVTVTMATRAAIDGGMFWELAYTLSDLHIQKIEDLREVRQVDHARKDVVADFAERVRQIREGRVSRTIGECQNYIFNHLFEEITLEQLSGLTGFNGNYISQRFKKETGMPFRAYVTSRRIEEACRLIKFTKLSFTEIAARLCFHDQSHFTKAFKKQTGVTPKQYRLDAAGQFDGIKP
ncbi:helix-turn-helix domain-containing protein [Cohnella panacarvi]|uniref:helix-turn-helix domain-containing protein n=1 Tax=Cohnella panacarvi TaxID=400776 RepID=UPI00047EFB31|nr:helix-turn-helix domain-containing protein [Cohnella panacarvi]